MIVSAGLAALLSDGVDKAGGEEVGGEGFPADAERLVGLHATSVTQRLKTNPNHHPWIILRLLPSSFTRCAETMKVVYHLPQKLSI